MIRNIKSRMERFMNKRLGQCETILPIRERYLNNNCKVVEEYRFDPNSNKYYWHPLEYIDVEIKRIF